VTAEPPARLVAALTDRALTIGTAESLTGGRLVARLVDVPGASRCVAGGIVAYSYDVKASVLGLDRADLDARGAVRAAVAEQMAVGAARVLGCDLALATTGVAGPGPDEDGVPAGTVWVALHDRRGPAGAATTSRRVEATGDRDAVRETAVAAALDLVAEALRDDLA
jgi:nicotinamide-nucleotide amidase